MGPSGSGKTSLLKILTGRLGGASKLDLGGTIRLDGQDVDPSDIRIRKQIAYVEQDVTIPATSTPREAIAFSARLRLDRNVRDDEIDVLVNDILDNLGLGHCADTLIGGGPLMRGGLSGGEKKRVQCGVELVTNPRIVVLGEREICLIYFLVVACSISIGPQILFDMFLCAFSENASCYVDALRAHTIHDTT